MFNKLRNLYFKNYLKKPSIMKTKNLLFMVTFILFNVFFLNSALCQKDTLFGSDQEEIFYLNDISSEQVKSIDKQLQEIKGSLKNYQKVEKQKSADGYKYIYKNDSEIQIISVFYLDKNINKKVDWYFSNNKLFYCEQCWTNIETSKIVNLEKFYLKDEQLFAWIKSENTLVDDKTDEFKDFAKELTNYVSKLKTDLIR